MTTADDVIFLVKKIAASDIKELGSDTTQNTYLLKYITRALKELAHIAYRDKVSDVLNITTDGYQTFLTGASPITDMYSPLRILDPNGRDTVKRTSYAAPTGWWRESGSSQIHTKGFSGNYTLHYIAYPADVTAVGNEVQFPDSGIMGLVFWTCGIVKESANGYEEANQMYQRAKERLRLSIAANDYGRGKSSGGWVPSLNDVDIIFK